MLVIAYRYQVGACYEALVEGVPIAPLDSRYTQVGLNLVSVQVCDGIEVDAEVTRKPK